MKFLPLWFIVLLAVLATGYYQFLYPPMILQRQTEQALSDVSKAVGTYDRAKVGEALQQYLSDAAQLHLEVSIVSMAQMDGSKPEIQDFGKPSFLSFIDNVLYSLLSYNYEPELKSFKLSADKKSAEVTFASKEYADGVAYFSGTPVTMRYSSDTLCTGQVIFQNKKSLLNKASCSMKLMMVPKPDEAYKIQQNPEAVRQLLR